MLSIKELEQFFTEYLPRTKAEIEALWKDNRGELNDFLIEWQIMTQGTWMQKYFDNMYYHSKNGSHKYTNPWEIM